MRSHEHPTRPPVNLVHLEREGRESISRRGTRDNLVTPPAPRTAYPPSQLSAYFRTPPDQVWLAMYHLMCEEECRKRYHFNSLRKNNILRVRKYLNDILLDQLPVLASVQR